MTKVLATFIALFIIMYFVETTQAFCNWFAGF